MNTFQRWIFHRGEYIFWGNIFRGEYFSGVNILQNKISTKIFPPQNFPFVHHYFWGRGMCQLDIFCIYNIVQIVIAFQKTLKSHGILKQFSHQQRWQIVLLRWNRHLHQISKSIFATARKTLQLWSNASQDRPYPKCIPSIPSHCSVDNCGDKLIDQEELLDTCYGWVGLVLEQGPLANQ